MLAMSYVSRASRPGAGRSGGYSNVVELEGALQSGLASFNFTHLNYSTPLMSSDIPVAVDTLSRVLEELNVTYAILGGAACQLLGSQRITIDIDFVIGLTDTMRSAEELAKILCGRPEFVAVNEYGVDMPALRIGGSNISLEIFDPEQWKAQVPHFSRVAEDRVKHTLPSGTTTYIFPQAWLLREKICTIQRRGHPGSLKFLSDATDIRFLTTLIKPDEARAGYLDFTTQDQAAFLPLVKAFLARQDIIDSLRLAVESVCKTE